MKLNYDTKIVAEKIVLVPYRKEHVEKYHKWMEDEELREMTASERLTLDEEYSMQQTWLHDSDKCTFIILDSDLYESTNFNEVDSMIGDINIYLSREEGETIGEISLMIAESAHRGQGKGKRATLCAIIYGMDQLKIDKFIVKISDNNAASVAMFLKLHFILECENKIFKEKTLALRITEELRRWIRSEEALLKYSVEKTRPNS